MERFQGQLNSEICGQYRLIWRSLRRIEELNQVNIRTGGKNTGKASRNRRVSKMLLCSLLISADIHYWGKDQLEKFDKYIICGHVPTYQLGPEHTGKVLETRAYLDLDAGAGYCEQGGRLACYRCEDGKCFYI